ncbi:GvpL/GvpF family gas vesicle protein [Pseudanabaena sp. FACHB-2040]|uniref:GvpL/GvpF family gas vesicle protein n=1 Tax=Pseudanabaena sp. FACHB-2040 TaxID=2692859 RepID=UPI0016858A5A|nr:GvpL/GvpF family gas vesicle protein [Pseudanabaena sp. FACHB-2040]MBD2259618.1 GvpL/GvpF family gas vesicle protein [Pseudanabaena sp. FACHB-2040]
MNVASESALYVYAVCRLPAAGLTLPLGIERETILVTVEEMAAIAEPGLDLAALQADDQRLLTAVLTHDRVICDLFNQTTLLPLRFGIQLAPDSLEKHLQDNLETYRRRLTTLVDKAEYQVKLTPAEIALPPLPEGLTGRDYFLAKKNRLQEQAVEQQRQQDELNRLVADIQAAYPKIRTGESDEGIPRLYLLLGKDQAQPLLQAAESWQRQSPHWQIALSEALPPYHFVS